MSSHQGIALISVQPCNFCCCRIFDWFLIPLARVGVKWGVMMMKTLKLWLFRRWLKKQSRSRTRRTLAVWVASGAIKGRKWGNL